MSKPRTSPPLGAIPDELPLAEPAALDLLAGRSVAIDRQLAGHSSASPGLLEALAQSADRMTRRKVAVNPQTPARVLLALAPSFPAEFFLNPAFDLMLMVDPKLLFELPDAVFRTILKRADCPAAFLEWAARLGKRNHQMALLGRADLPRELLETVAKGPYIKPAERAAARLLGLST